MGTVHRAQGRPQADHRLLRFTAQVVLITAALAAAMAAGAVELLDNIRPVTPAGGTSGTFTADGTAFLFQREGSADPPSPQFSRLDLATGEIAVIAPGTGSPGRDWVHPENPLRLLVSAPGDPEADAPTVPRRTRCPFTRKGRHARDFDAKAELFTFDPSTGAYTNLTGTPGYDAEGAYSPTNHRIVFASNRHAYESTVSGAAAKKVRRDQSGLVDLYMMDSGGRQVRRLTDAQGYDGMPSFSADGTRICWQRFSEDGRAAAVWIMDADGTDKRAITPPGTVSVAPCFHPSGDYLVFAMGDHRRHNFDLYVVDAEGTQDAVRVTDTPGYDGLPSFSPDGATLAWTAERRAAGQPQILFADWDDAAAREALGLSSGGASEAIDPAVAGLLNVQPTLPQILAQDIRTHVYHFASDAMNGRFTGSPGEAMATEYVANFFQKLGLEPAGDNGTWYQTFDFTFGVQLDAGNRLVATTPTGRFSAAVDAAWLPLSFSAMGEIERAGVVFGGYGIVAPGTQSQPAYDSYSNLNVKDQWVLVFRGLPAGVSKDRKAYLANYANLCNKAIRARARDARGIIFVRGPAGRFVEELIALELNGALGGKRIGAISLSDATAEALLAHTNKSLAALQARLDTGAPEPGFAIPGVTLDVEVRMENKQVTGRNVLARLRIPGSDPKAPVVLVGAHVDHLGNGQLDSNSCEDYIKRPIYYGADDNASGTAAMMEVAEYFVSAASTIPAARDIVFAAWSGEEIDLKGSEHYVKTLATQLGAQEDISGAIAACLNMDMVGRLGRKLTIHGYDSSSVWRDLVKQGNRPLSLPLELRRDNYPRTDAKSFYMYHVPILSVSNPDDGDYHKPSDTADKINYPGAERVAKFMADIAQRLVEAADEPDYQINHN